MKGDADMEEKKIIQSLDDAALDKVAGGANNDSSGKWHCEHCHALWQKQEDDLCPFCGQTLILIQ